MRILILGAGPTGLGAAWRLNQLGHDDWQLWERESVPGGLARSETDDHGFTWDMGGHVQFSHYQTFDDLMDQALGTDGWLHHERESWVRISGTWVPYPFQYNIHRLPREQTLRCLKGLIDLAGNGAAGRKPANFEELIRGSFGEGLSEIFMIPYNYKVWAYPPADMSTGWIGERVALPDLGRIAESVVMDKDNISWGPNNTFRFPAHGGTGAVWRAVAERLPADRLQFGKEVVRIDAAAGKVIAADGSEAEYDALISTLPLDTCVELADLHDLKHAADALVHSTVHIIGVGLEGQPGPELARKCWMYFPEDNCPFYRVTVFSNYSPNNVPDIDRYWSLMAEVSQSPKKPVDETRVVEDTIEGMINAGLIEKKTQVHHTWYMRLAKGYPTPALGRDEALNVLLPGLEQHGIYSRGRFGAWKYEVANQDHSMMQGVEVVNRLLHGSPELTIWFPGVVNRMHPIYGKEWL